LKITNSEKFIEVMNKYFDAGLTKDNLQARGGLTPYCTPCGLFRKGACRSFSCAKCADWWDKEWKPEGEMDEIVIGIDEKDRQEAQARLNAKNKKLGRF